jgi:hypothetical protein
MSEPLTSEALRELARRIRETLPSGLSYALIVWPHSSPDDCAYFSNAPKVDSVIALETMLGHGLRN